MKKVILPTALLAFFAFAACSSDDDSGGNCVTCALENDSEQICRDDMTSEEYNQTISIYEELGYNCS